MVPPNVFEKNGVLKVAQIIMHNIIFGTYNTVIPNVFKKNAVDTNQKKIRLHTNYI
jgi:hypothetical protein